MVRLLVVVACLLALLLPVLGQDSDAEQVKQIEKLIEQLGDPDTAIRTAAAQALRNAGPAAAPAVPALLGTLDDPDVRVRRVSAQALGKIGPAAVLAVPALIVVLEDGDMDHDFVVDAHYALAEIGAPAVPALITALSNKDASVRAEMLGTLGWSGVRLKNRGTLLWWVVPRVYWMELICLLLLLVTWFALAARVPRHRPVSKLKQAALLPLTAAVPSALACSAVGYAVTREWAQGFLPDAVLTVLPFPVAAVLSVGFVCVLAAVGVCSRKQSAPPEAGASQGLGV